jgi:prophage regulatory protein
MIPLREDKMKINEREVLSGLALARKEPAKLARMAKLADPMATERNGAEDRSLMRLPEVKAFTGLSKSSVYGQIREATFPAPVRVGARAVAWRRSEVRQWAEERVHTSR